MSEDLKNRGVSWEHVSTIIICKNEKFCSRLEAPGRWRGGIYGKRSKGAALKGFAHADEEIDSGECMLRWRVKKKGNRPQKGW